MQMYEVLICYGLHMKLIFGGDAVRIVEEGKRRIERQRQVVR
jgi:hypothetical protein